MKVAHFNKVDLPSVRAKFSDCGLHRGELKIPFTERSNGRTLCIVGQNPSSANEHEADKTLHFLERYVFERLPEYSQIIMLNLYSRVDTKKIETSNLNHQDFERLLLRTIEEHQDFLMVFGKLKNQGAYNFPKRVRSLQHLFAGKSVYKLDIGVGFAPHPGNLAIHYHNTNFGLTQYDFRDVAPDA